MSHLLEARVHVEEACRLASQARDSLTAQDPAYATALATTATAHAQIAQALATLQEDDVT